MNRLRAFALLIALLAFVASPFGAGSVPHGASAAEQTLSDCPDHAPPPDCPAQGTAKHAAGECCPLMAGIVALLPPALPGGTVPPLHARPTAPAPGLAGVVVTKDPPPPRV